MAAPLATTRRGDNETRRRLGRAVGYPHLVYESLVMAASPVLGCCLLDTTAS